MVDHQEDDRQALTRAFEIDRGLSERTIDFLESLGRWVFDEGKDLTAKQRERLFQILEEHGK